MFYYICYPFAALLRLFYNVTNSYGLSLILFTLVVKLVMMPFQMKSKKSMVRMNRMNGQIQEIQKKYANNPQKQQEELQKFYTENGVNPMGGCLWSFLPLPILIALYNIIREPIVYFMNFGSKANGQAVLEAAVLPGDDLPFLLDDEAVVVTVSTRVAHGAIADLERRGALDAEALAEIERRPVRDDPEGRRDGIVLSKVQPVDRREADAHQVDDIFHDDRTARGGASELHGAEVPRDAVRELHRRIRRGHREIGGLAGGRSAERNLAGRAQLERAAVEDNSDILECEARRDAQRGIGGDDDSR